MLIILTRGVWDPIPGFQFWGREKYMAIGGAGGAAGGGADHGAADCASGGDHGGDTGASN